MKTILLVDDEEDILFALGRRLRSQGYRVETAADGVQALAMVKGARPDLVILDVMMPELDGFQVCRMLRDDPATRALPVMFLTAKGQEADRCGGGEVGATAYMTKPFEDRELLLKVSELLGPLP